MPNPRGPWKPLFIVILVLVSAFVPFPVHAQGGSGEPNREIPGLDIIILVDESETMWNTTDTEGVRVNTVNFFVDMLSSEHSGAVHRLGIVAFGTEPHVIPYTVLDSPVAAAQLKEQYAAVHRTIGARKDQQYTDINQALRAALAMVGEQHDPGRKSALVLISDGQPTTAQVDEEKGQQVVMAYLDETRSLLEQLQGYVYSSDVCSSRSGIPMYMVGLGIDKLGESSSPEFIATYREFWQGISARSAGYYKEADRVQEMQGISTYIFSQLLCVPSTPVLAVHSPQVLDYQVYGNYFQIIFTISAKESPEVQTAIHRPREDGTPGGVALSTDEEGVSWQSNDIDYEVWSVRYTEPWAGTWQVVLEGEGRAEFSYVVFPNVKIDLMQPDDGFLPAEQPFTVRARIADENGLAVDVPVKDFQLEVAGEGGFRKQLPLERVGDSYVVQLEPLEQTGEYSLTLHALLPDGTSLYEHKWVTLISAPWIEMTEPAWDASHPPGDSIPLQANVHLAGATSFEDLKLIATLLKGNESVQTVEMSRGATSSQNGESLVAYSGAFQAPEASGEYVVQAEMMAILPGGRVFYHEITPIPLSVVAPPPLPSVTPLPTSAPTPLPTPPPTPVLAALSTPTPVGPLAFLTRLGRQPLGLPGLLGLLLLALLLALLSLRLRRRHRAIPDKIKLLAELMRSRRETGELPYVLILGSGASVMLGSRSMRRVVRAIAGSGGLEQFYETLNGLSPLERYVILKKHFSRAGISSGYRHLAELIKKGFFDIIFTTNLDSFLEGALAGARGNGRVDLNREDLAEAERPRRTVRAGSRVGKADFRALVCGERSSAEILVALEAAEPRAKIVKLHGDVQARAFAFTPGEISLLGGVGERPLRRYLSRDLIIVGHGPLDYDVSRGIELDGGSIWYVGESPPPADDPVCQAMKARGTPANMISGEFGLFDLFFEALRRELL